MFNNTVKPSGKWNSIYCFMYVSCYMYNGTKDTICMGLGRNRHIFLKKKYSMTWIFLIKFFNRSPKFAENVYKYKMYNVYLIIIGFKVQKLKYLTYWFLPISVYVLTWGSRLVFYIFTYELSYTL